LCLLNELPGYINCRGSFFVRTVQIFKEREKLGT
jgi:hypothetical protein